MNTRRLAFLFLAAVLLTSLGVATVLHFRSRASSAAQIRASGLPAIVPTSLANLMGLSPIPSKIAPDFVLTDQHGHRMSLASLRGRPVVLEFMDPHCTDICPIISQELVNAFHDLPLVSKNTAFLAVNVNRFHASTADMRAFSNEHNLSSLPTWHFFTGHVAALEKVWADYGIYVYAPNPHADVVHSGIIYFIDGQGRERFVASPVVDHTSAGAAYLPAPDIVSWGKGIALVAQSLAN